MNTATSAPGHEWILYCVNVLEKAMNPIILALIVGQTSSSSLV